MIKLLSRHPLFHNIDEPHIQRLFQCVIPRKKTYAKGEILFHRGEVLEELGLVLSGGVHIVKEDYWGNQGILAKLGPNELFGETYAFLPEEPLGVSVIAASDTSVIFLNIKEMTTTCSHQCPFHTQLIENLLSIFAKKNLMLVNKMEHITQRSTREKLLSYLSAQSLKTQSSSFTIPFNRQELADYLSVERSAMSSALGKLRDEKILSFHKNQFKLLK